MWLKDTKVFGDSADFDGLVLLGIFDGIGGALEALPRPCIALGLYASSETNNLTPQMVEFAGSNMLELDVHQVTADMVQGL